MNQLEFHGSRHPKGFSCRFFSYCWWTISCTSWYGKYPIIDKVLYIPGGCLGFLPSTVWFHWVFGYIKIGWLESRCQTPTKPGVSCDCGGGFSTWWAANLCEGWLNLYARQKSYSSVHFDIMMYYGDYRCCINFWYSVSLQACLSWLYWCSWKGITNIELPVERHQKTPWEHGVCWWF